MSSTRPSPRTPQTAFAGIENLLSIGRHERDRVRGMLPVHRHDPDEMEIICMDKGSRTYLIEQQPHRVQGGEVFIVMPGEEHGCLWPGVPARIYWMKLSLPAGGDAFLNLRGAPAQSLILALRTIKSRHFQGSPWMKPCLDRVIRCRNEQPPGPAATAILCGYVLAFLVDLVDCAEKNRHRGSNAWTDKILRYVDQHLSAAIQLPDMARHMGMSLSGFKARFKEEFGTPPADYIMSFRIDRAKAALLSDMNRPVTAIALDLGFASSQHFATIFKHYAFCTPSQYRIKVRAARLRASRSE